jgi:hypothetical protein
MPMSDEPDAYQTYLLRLWRARCQGRWQWRASIESPQTGERQSFATLDKLCNHLKTRLLECQSDADPGQISPAGESEGVDSEDEPPTGQDCDRQTFSFSAVRRDESQCSMASRAQKKRRSAP